MKRLAGMLVFAACAWASEGGEHAEPPVMYKWINFAILAAGLGYVAVKSGGPALRGRAEEILDSLSAARRRSEETARKAAEMDRKMAGLQAQIEAVRQEAKQEMEREAGRIQAETAELLAKVEQHALQEIAAAGSAARKGLQVHAADLALSLARQKAQARLTPTVQDSLVDGFVRSLN